MAQDSSFDNFRRDLSNFYREELTKYAEDKIRSILGLPNSDESSETIDMVVSLGILGSEKYLETSVEVQSRYDHLRPFLKAYFYRQWETDEAEWFREFIEKQAQISWALFNDLLTQMANDSEVVFGERNDLHLSVTLHLLFNFKHSRTPPFDRIVNTLIDQGASGIQTYLKNLNVEENQRLFDEETNPVYHALKEYIGAFLKKKLQNIQNYGNDLPLPIVQHGWIEGLNRSNLPPDIIQTLQKLPPIVGRADVTSSPSPPTSPLSPPPISLRKSRLTTPVSPLSPTSVQLEMPSITTPPSPLPRATINHRIIHASVATTPIIQQATIGQNHQHIQDLHLSNLIQAGEIIYINQTFSHILQQIITQQHTNTTNIIQQLQIPIMYLLKRHQNLEEFYYLFYSNYLQVFTDPADPIIPLRMLIDHLLRRSDLSLSRKLLFLLSQRNPVPFVEPSMTFVPDIIHVWDYSTPILLSFGLGSCQGKSILLKRIFLSSFEETSPTDDYFNNTIDIDFGYQADPQRRRPINIADAHGSMNKQLLERIHRLFDAFLIHIRYKDLQTNERQLQDLLHIINTQQRYRLLIIRDVDQKEKSSCEQYLQTHHPSENFIILVNMSNPNHRDVTYATHKLLDQILAEVPKSSTSTRETRSQLLFDLMDDQYKQHTEQVSYVIQPLKNHLLEVTQRPHLASSYLPEYFQYVELCRLKLELAQANFHGNRTDQEIQSLRQKIRHFENTRPAQTNTNIYRLFLDVLESRDMLTCLDTLHTDLRQERKQAVSIADLAGNLPIHNNLTLEVLWRNVIVCSRYQSKAEQTFLHQKYFDYIQAGYPFELIDGDNFALPYEFLSNTLARFSNRRMLVLSVIGPQNSGKSTLLNHMFGTLFDVRDGRCTRGVYGTLIHVNHNDYDDLLVLDTEGLLGIERTDTEYDRRIVLFCLAVSHVVLVNVAREIDSTVHEMLQLCQESLQKMGTDRSRQTTIHIILNQKLNIDMHHNTESIQSMLNISADHFHTLPSAYQKLESSTRSNRLAIIQSTPDFLERVQQLADRIFRSINLNDVVDGSTWLSSSHKIFDALQKTADLTYYKDIHQRNLDHRLRDQVRQRLMQIVSTQYRQNLTRQLMQETEDMIKQRLNSEKDRIQQDMEVELEQVFKLLRVNEALRQRNREFLRVQIYGMFIALRTSIIEDNRRSQVINIFQRAQEDLRQTIDMSIRHGGLMSFAEAQRQFNQIFDEKIEWIDREFNARTRFDHAMDNIYQNYQIYENDCLVEKNLFKRQCVERIDQSTQRLQSDDDFKETMSRCFTYDAYGSSTRVDINPFNPTENSPYTLALIDTLQHLNREVLRNQYRALLSGSTTTSTDDFQMKVRGDIQNEQPTRLDNSRFDETKLFLPMSNLFRRVTDQVVNMMQTGQTSRVSVRQVQTDLIQQIVGVVASMIVDVNDELNPFCLKLAVSIKSSLHTLAMIILTRCHFHEQLQYFRQLLDDFKSKRDDLKQIYVTGVSQNRSEDKASATNLLHQVREHLKKSLWNDAQELVRKEINQYENINRKYIQDLIDGQVNTHTDNQWYLNYVSNPTTIIEQFFIELWSKIKQGIDQKMNDRKEQYVRMARELFSCVEGVTDHLRRRVATSNQLIDEIFQVETHSSMDSVFTEKCQCMMEVIYVYLSEQRICSSFKVNNNRYRLIDEAQKAFEDLLRERQPSRELSSLIQPMASIFKSLQMSDVLQFVKRLCDGQSTVVDHIHGLPCDVDHVDQNDSYGRILIRVLGCRQVCPCCRRPCDVDHTRTKSQPGARNNQHRCQTGHNLRAMNGYKIEITNEPSLFMCEQISDDQILEINKRRYHWSRFKESHPEWNFDSLLSEQELRILHGKFLVVWRRVGPELCRRYGMTYVSDNHSLKIRHESFHYILVLDASGSMQGQRWRDLLKALEEFLTRRRALHTEDRVTIIVFSHKVDRVIENEDIRDVKIHQIHYLGGETSFQLAFEDVRRCVKFYAGQERLNRAHGRFSIVFMSDGEAEYPDRELKRLVKDYRSQIKRFWTVRLGGDASTSPAVLHNINRTMNGSFMDVATSVDLINAYAEIANNAD